MEKVKKEKHIKILKGKQIKPKRIKKIKVQSNNVIIRYDPNSVYVKFFRIKYKYIDAKYIYISYVFI